MDFKIKAGVALLLGTFFLSGCEFSMHHDFASENGIGESLKSISALTTREGVDQSSIAIFDKTTKRIDQFDVSTMTLQRSMPVSNVNLPHYLLYDQGGNYVIDLSEKNLTVFNSASTATRDPLTFQGKPRTAAFRSSTGHLIVYDDLGTVGLLKVDPSGQVTGRTVLGSTVVGNLSIQSGDITSDGRLVVALGDGSIAVINIDQTIALHHWVLDSSLASNPFATGMTNISWVASLASNADQVLVRARGKIALISLANQAILSTKVIGNSQVIMKYGKTPDPHLLYQDSAQQTAIVYAQGSQVLSKSVFFDWHNLLTSRLNLAQDSWTYLDAGGETLNNSDDLNVYRIGRKLRRVRFSDLLAVQSLAIVDNVQTEMTEAMIFSLYPSELGYATRTSISDGSEMAVKLFNINQIH
jgi:hypothetical protein